MTIILNPYRKTRGAIVILVLMGALALVAGFGVIKVYEIWVTDPQTGRIRSMEAQVAASQRCIPVPTDRPEAVDLGFTREIHWWVEIPDEKFNEYFPPPPLSFLGGGEALEALNGMDPPLLMGDSFGTEEELTSCLLGIGMTLQGGRITSFPVGFVSSSTRTKGTDNSATNSSWIYTNVVMVIRTNNAYKVTWTNIANWSYLDTTSFRDTNGYPLRFLPRGGGGEPPKSSQSIFRAYGSPLKTNWVKFTQFYETTNGGVQVYLDYTKEPACFYMIR